MSGDDNIENAERDSARDLELEHARLRRDVDLVRAYGEAHLEAWVDLWIENEPSGRVVTVFAGCDVDAHESALRSLVAHPDQLEVRRTDRYPRAHLLGIEAQVRHLASTAERGSFRNWGIGRGRLNVTVRATRSDLAQRLLDDYGDAVTLRVGFLGYPDPTMMDDDGPRCSPPVTERAPLLPAQELEVLVERGLAVRSGEQGRGILHVHNIGSAAMVISTNGAVTARIIDPRTELVVGGYEFVQHAPLVEFRIESGGVADVPLLVGTASTDPRLGYCVPPGTWSIEAPINLQGRGVLRTPLRPISVTA